MKLETKIKYFLIKKQKEKKFLKHNEFRKQINDIITITYQNIMDENRLLRNQIIKFEHKFENFNKTIVEVNNSMKTRLKSIENEILIIDLNFFLNNIILLENKILNLTKNIQNLEIGSNVEMEDGPSDRDGTDNIWHASKEGSLAAVKYWHAQDPASIHRKKGNNKYTPLHYASQKGHLKIVLFLLSKIVDVDEVDCFNTTSLMSASLHGHVPVVKALLDNGAEINHKNKFKSTPLHYAVYGNCLSIVQVLIQKGANRSIRDESNKTPLERTKEYGDSRYSITEYLTLH